MKMRFIEGEEVLAKHPETEEFCKGMILSMRGDLYKIQFQPGMEYSIHRDDVKVSRPSRNTMRLRTRAASKSPARHSPSRRARRSSARSPASVNRGAPRSTKYAKILLPRLSVPKDETKEHIDGGKKIGNEETITDLKPLQTRLEEAGMVTRRSMRLLSDPQKTQLDHKMVMLTRNINRAVSLPVERKSYMLNTASDGKERGHSVQRDQALLKMLNYEEDIKPDSHVTQEKYKKGISLVSEPQEWGGWLGTLILMCVSPLITIVPQFLCTKEQCGFILPNVPNTINSYINLNAFLSYIGFLLFMILSSLIPIGKIVDGQHSKIGILQYRINGLLVAVLSIIIFNTCMYKGIRINDFLLENSVQLCSTGWLLGTILSLFLYIKGGKAPIANLNMHASTDSAIYNFWQGREINPRIGPVDFKINLFRTAIVGMMILNLAVVTKVVEEAESFNDLNIPALMAASLQIFYAMDVFFFESTILTSFEVMYEGTGYMLCTGYMLFPFLPTLTTKYILYQNMRFNKISGIFLLSYVTGYLIYRISNLQKDTFRRNPISPSISHLETIPTSRGKKLLVSGLWGYIRHPNYFGDIIMWWSVACISSARDILPYYYPICCTMLLFHRAIRDNERCKTRYSLAWEEYTSRVKYMILYGLF